MKNLNRRQSSVITTAFSLVVAAAAWPSLFAQEKSFIQSKETVTTLKVSSSSFAHNGPIGAKYTYDGKDVSPSLKWEGAPTGTKSFALICDDPDAMSVANKVWVHWVIYEISAKITELAENVAKTETVAALGGAKQGTNDSGRVGYGGPCPPRGHGVHHYHFKLYALDTELNLPAKATKSQVEEAMRGHILGSAELIGTYQRK